MKKIVLIISVLYLAVSPVHDVFADITQIQGEVVKVSRRAEMVLVSTAHGIEIVEYGDSTKFVNLKDDSSFVTALPLKIRVDDSNPVYFADEIAGPPPIELRNGKIISLEEFLGILQEGSKVYDMRPVADYVMGHIPGASPSSEVINKKKTVVFYCSRPDCEESGTARDIASDSHVKKLFFAGGMDYWKEKRKPLNISLKYLQMKRHEEFPYILIDIRNKEATEKGFIPGAVSIPFDVIKYTGYRFPAYKKATIIVYGDDTQDSNSLKAAKIIAGWGYKDVLNLYEGFEGYGKSGGEISKGKIGEEIDYEVPHADREIPREAFIKYVEARPGNVIIIDVREEDEVKKGKFRNSVNIPLDELQYRFDEIDRTKSVITHCASGTRATIAYYILKKAGFNASCLNAFVEFDDSGVYSISDN